MKKPYYLKKRGDYWYYRLNPESGLVEDENLNYISTGCRNRKAAEAFMADLLSADPVLPSFREYAEPFFIWGECPHIRRVLEEKGHFTERHARIQRGRLKNHVFNDPFAKKRLSEIKRADLFDLRSRLLRKCSPATTNKVVDVVKVVIREAVIREELDHDPTDLVNRVRYRKQTRGTFKPVFLVTKHPPKPSCCELQLHSNLFGVADGVWIIPHPTEEGTCDEE